MTNSTNNNLTLPQLTISGNRYGPMPWLLLTGGRPPASPWLKQLPAVREIFAADHGLDTCKACGLIPTYILGDGDSASPATWAWGKGLGVPMEEFPAAKDYTDTQLALQKMAKAPVILITGAFGGRLDHLYSILFSCAEQEVPCLLADEQETVCFVHSGEEISFHFHQRPQAISLLPMTENCTDVCLNNVHWPLHHAQLSMKLPNAISNELLPDKDVVSISLGQGTLAFYCHWGMDLKTSHP